MKKHFICFMRSLIDAPMKELDAKTPFEKAKARSLKRIFAEGAPWQSWPEELAILSQLLDLEKNTRKGPLGAYALGHRLRDGQAAFLGHFASTTGQEIIDASSKNISDSECKAFCFFLSEKLEHQGCSFIPLEKGAFLFITNMAPLVKRAETTPLEPALSQSIQRAQGKNWLSLPPFHQLEPSSLSIFQHLQEMLLAHPINELKRDLEEELVDALFLFEGGAPLNLSLIDKRSKSLLITPSRPLQGLFQALGGSVYFLKSEEKRFSHIEQIKSLIDEWSASYDTLIFDIHYLKESSKRKALLEKIKTIEWLDQFFISPLMERAALEQGQLSLFLLDSDPGADDQTPFLTLYPK
ncbi:MAG: cofactor-independent phosphoglycerate mutase [Chlamydiales bacterium]|jgi:2,3-bisphosphoglycerate-independent phosphoglycerate mutase|nr:cofactor-independent phosphoglycerate mutase [Chlamydiales bacterium]